MMDNISDRNKPLALVIDDDLSIRLAMQATMAKVGFDVKDAESGPRGISLFEEERPDLILLDVVMPGMDGFETCTAIRQKPGGEFVQILMVTGLNDTDSIEKAFEVGANGFINKPLNWVMLGHRARYMLRAGKAFQELNKSKLRLAKTQELAKLGNWEINLMTNEFYCSVEARSLLGLKNGTTCDNLCDFLSTIKAEERDLVQDKIEMSIDGQHSFQINYQIDHIDGSVRHILNQAEILCNEYNEPEVMLGAVQDVSQLKIAEEEIRLLAFYDGLTGLANRMLFLERLNREIAKAKRKKQQFALLFLDLDQFKRVNDTFGHHFGDMLLKKVSEVLENSIRKTDTASRLKSSQLDSLIARLGGDEFTILLSDLQGPEYAGLVARRLLRNIGKPIHIEGQEINITTSIGISLYPLDGDDAHVLLRNADTAMYHAKNTGRNRYQFFVDELNAAVVERFALESDIPKAIENGEFTLYFQPKVEVRTMKIIGAEALIRWCHPLRGMIPPDKFINIAEESGQVYDIDQWVIETACSHWGEWKKAGLAPGIVSINLSGSNFLQKAALRAIINKVKNVGIDLKDIELEITENVLLRKTDDTIAFLQQLQNIGVRIALDDFGTGYSSLSYLSSFQVDTIKIDRSFVMGCAVNRNNLVIIRAIIAMGHSLGMKIVAEGIETDEELLLIKNLGTDEVQGYFLAPPLPADEFETLLVKQVSKP